MMEDYGADQPAASFVARVTGKIIAVWVLLFVAACGGYAPVTYPPVNVPDALTTVVPNKNYAAADKQSFRPASVGYPTRYEKSFHTIPVGDYLLSRVVLTLPENVGITAIRMERFDCKCGNRGGFIARLGCTFDLTVNVRDGNGERVLTVQGDADVGRFYISGDVAPPFNFGNRLTETIHGQAALAVDAAAMSLGEKYRTAAR